MTSHRQIVRSFIVKKYRRFNFTCLPGEMGQSLGFRTSQFRKKILLSCPFAKCKNPHISGDFEIRASLRISKTKSCRIFVTPGQRKTSLQLLHSLFISTLLSSLLCSVSTTYLHKLCCYKDTTRMIMYLIKYSSVRNMFSRDEEVVQETEIFLPRTVWFEILHCLRDITNLYHWLHFSQIQAIIRDGS